MVPFLLRRNRSFCSDCPSEKRTKNQVWAYNPFNAHTLVYEDYDRSLYTPQRGRQSRLDANSIILSLGLEYGYATRSRNLQGEWLLPREKYQIAMYDAVASMTQKFAVRKQPEALPEGLGMMCGDEYVLFRFLYLFRSLHSVGSHFVSAVYLRDEMQLLYLEPMSEMLSTVHAFLYMLKFLRSDSVMTAFRLSFLLAGLLLIFWERICFPRGFRLSSPRSFFFSRVVVDSNCLPSVESSQCLSSVYVRLRRPYDVTSPVREEVVAASEQLRLSETTRTLVLSRASCSCGRCVGLRQNGCAASSVHRVASCAHSLRRRPSRRATFFLPVRETAGFVF